MISSSQQPEQFNISQLLPELLPHVLTNVPTSQLVHLLSSSDPALRAEANRELKARRRDIASKFCQIPLSQECYDRLFSAIQQDDGESIRLMCLLGLVDINALYAFDIDIPSESFFHIAMSTVKPSALEAIQRCGGFPDATTAVSALSSMMTTIQLAYASRLPNLLIRAKQVLSIFIKYYPELAGIALIYAFIANNMDLFSYLIGQGITLDTPILPSAIEGGANTVRQYLNLLSNRGPLGVTWVQRFLDLYSQEGGI